MNKNTELIWKTNNEDFSKISHIDPAFSLYVLAY